MLLAPVLDAFAAIVGFLAESKLAVAGLVGYMGALATKSIVNAVASIFSSSFALGPFGLAIAGAGIAGLYAAVSSAKSQTADDMVQPGYGKRTILSPEGAIQLNDKDTIIAGTDLEGKKKTQAVTSSSTSVDIGPLVQEMAAVKNLLGQLLAKDTNVYMDSTKVGEALRVSAVKIN